MTASGLLPPKNKNALGLYMTDEEYLCTCKLVKAESHILQARIYGSRQTGVRRQVHNLKPLDIDIAIQVFARDPSETYTVFFDVVQSIKSRAGNLLLQIEDMTDSTSASFDARQNGVLILAREPN